MTHTYKIPKEKERKKEEIHVIDTKNSKTWNLEIVFVR